VIKRYECNKCTVVVNAMGIPESILRTRRKQAEEIQSCKSVTSMTASEITQNRARTVEEL
jgi:hypothetical protein